MTKTEIQVPDELYRELRRGAERLLQVDPESSPADTAPLTPPTSREPCWKGLSAALLSDPDPCLA